MRAIDIDESGSVDFLEFLRVFNAVRPLGLAASQPPRLVVPPPRPPGPVRRGR
jgi:hypothetical protein